MTDSVKINNEQISSVLSDSTNQMKDSYNNLTNDLNSYSKKYKDDVKNIISDTSKQINDTLTTSYDKINSNLDNAGQKSEELINKTIQGLDQSMQTELQRSIESLGSGLASLSKKFVDDYGPLTQKLHELIRLAEQSRTRELSMSDLSNLFGSPRNESSSNWMSTTDLMSGLMIVFMFIANIWFLLIEKQKRLMKLLKNGIDQKLNYWKLCITNLMMI